MKPGGRPLFDLNELPEEDDEVSSVASNHENHVQATTGDSAVGADAAMQQHSSTIGDNTAAGQVKQEANASVSGQVKQESNVSVSGPALFKNLASGSVVLHPGQHPLSCFKPFSGLQPSYKSSSDDGSSGKDPVSKLIALPSALDSCRPRVVPVIRVVESPNTAVEEAGEIAGIAKDTAENKDTTQAMVKKEMPNLNLDAEGFNALTKGSSSSSDDRVEPAESLPLPSDVVKRLHVNVTPAESIIDGSSANPASQNLPPQLQSSECKSSIAGKRRSDEKDVMLGKKRNRQTVFLDMHEVKNVVGPPKPMASRRSTPSLPRLLKQNTSEKLPGEFNSQEEKKEPSPPPLSGRSQQIPDGVKSNHSSNNNKKGMPLVSDVPVEGAPPPNNSMKQACAEDKQRQYAKPLCRKPHMPPVAPLIADERPAGSSHRSLVKKGMPNNNYRKPQVSSGASYPSLDTSVERMHREATCDRLWQVPGEAELRRVPGSFESVEEYVRVFEPLLFEECRAQLHNTWEESCESVSKDAHMPVSIKVVERRERGWYDAVLIPLDPQAKLNFKEGDAAVLSSPKPGSAGGRIKRAVNGNTPENAVDPENAGKVAGIVRRYFPLDTRDQKGAILHFHRGESVSDMTEKIFEKFQIKSVVWYLTVLGSIATTQREYIALHSFRRLNSRMINAILEPKPELFPSNEEGSQPPATPECFTTAFSDHLHRTFNSPQLVSIKWAAVHTADETNGNGSGRRREPWSFTLVQGPPGTGKTHTVWGMLNVIHLVQYQRYYEALLRKLAPGCLDSGADDNVGRYSSSSSSSSNVVEGSGSIDEVLQKMDESLARVLPKLCPKPRMLVCAPSNAATDELLTRVLERGFIDGEMKVYRPDVARVGIDTQSRAAQAVSVERRSEQLLGMGREAVMTWIQQLRVRESGLSQRITGLQRELTAATAATRSQGTLGVDPDVLAARDQSRDSRLKELAQAVEERDKVLVEMSRLLIVESQFHHSRGFSLENVRAKLETSFAKEAEIVFTTVSSSGRRIFSNLAHGFDMVVIDEAAQASEVAVLPPLILGAARCVLVGDPQQLPATVISRAANTLQYSRSLFERFQQAGCPTLLLSVQYRMHPHIRDFPSRYFYQNCLADSDAIKALPDEPYHKDPLLRPYLFYDISHGRESHRGGSVSYQNILEAQFAVRLYDYLQNSLKAAGLPKVSVGVITPYKLQLKCLQQEFEPVLSSEVDGKGVYINTVDAFQGQERDVIIMSCVRASNHGVGFVSDVRRMNVALTRARRCLWVMGNATALAQSEAWSDLIADAKDRNCFVSMENAAVKTLMNTKLPGMPPVAGRSPGILRLPRQQGFSRSEFQSNSPSDGFTPQSRGRGGHDKQQQMQQSQQTQQAVAGKPQTEDSKTERK